MGEHVLSLASVLNQLKQDSGAMRRNQDRLARSLQVWARLQPQHA